MRERLLVGVLLVDLALLDVLVGDPDLLEERERDQGREDQGPEPEVGCSDERGDREVSRQPDRRDPRAEPGVDQDTPGGLRREGPSADVLAAGPEDQVGLPDRRQRQRGVGDRLLDLPLERTRFGVTPCRIGRHRRARYQWPVTLAGWPAVTRDTPIG